MLIHHVAARAGAVAVHVLAPRMSPVAEPVEAEGNPVAFEKARALVERKAHHIVERIEAVVLRPLSGGGRVAVIDPMVAPVVEEAQRTGGFFVVILHSQRGHPPCDALVAVQQRGRHGAGVRCVEMGYIRIGPHAPAVGRLITQRGIAAVLLEVHIGTVSVRAVVRAADDTRKATFTNTVGQLRLQRVVGAVAGMQVGPHAVLVHPAGNDIHYAAHSVRPVEYGRRTAQHLHAVGQQRLVGIGYGVSEDAGILRMSVYQHHQPGIAAAQSAQRNTARRAVRDAIAHHAARSGEQARHLLGKYRKQRGLHGLFKFVAVHYRDGL
ncbi:hypothetical protein BACDOR_04581 [Phocaeicola dorei DSM 17855]|uniref:Uncharacterized protein n=1 Tax=Phocaeicola dorei DSM 17855 TaxID=483217 RepID=B6W4W6_9BACT|nr:hypothetical protein BACDOR_04581 [Phocaeicola dorei DSM 17855]